MHKRGLQNFLSQFNFLFPARMSQGRCSTQKGKNIILTEWFFKRSDAKLDGYICIDALQIKEIKGEKEEKTSQKKSIHRVQNAQSDFYMYMRS